MKNILLSVLLLYICQSVCQNSEQQEQQRQQEILLQDNQEEQLIQRERQRNYPDTENFQKLNYDDKIDQFHNFISINFDQNFDKEQLEVLTQLQKNSDRIVQKIEKTETKKMQESNEHVRICPVCKLESSKCYADSSRLKKGIVHTCGCKKCGGNGYQ